MIEIGVCMQFYYLNEHTPTKLIESTSEVQSIGRTSIGLLLMEVLLSVNGLRVLDKE